MPRGPACRPGDAGELAVLREPEYRKLFAGQVASLLGDGMVNVALAFAVIGLGGGAAAVGLVFACGRCRWSRAC